MTPTVTVLTAVRNGEAHLSATVASIRAQTFGDWEYVIVDDGSIDRTPEMLSAFADEDDRIRLIRRDDPGGPFVAANQGLRHARGRYIVRTDADDVSNPTRIERQVRYLREHPELRACGSHWQLMSDEGDPYQAPRVIPDLPRTLKWRLCVRGGPPHSTLCIEREALDEIGGYRELAVAQDFRLLCDLSRRDWLGIVPEILLHYRRHAAQLRARASDLQAELGDRALYDHLCELLPEPPTPSDVSEVHRLTRSRISLARGYRAIRRWESWWRGDANLDDEDKAVLVALGGDVRRVFAHHRLRHTTVAGAFRWCLGVVRGRT